MWRHVWLIARLGVRRSLRDRSILIMALVAPIAIAVVEKSFPKVFMVSLVGQSIGV